MALHWTGHVSVAPTKGSAEMNCDGLKLKPDS